MSVWLNYRPFISWALLPTVTIKVDWRGARKKKREKREARK